MVSKVDKAKCVKKTTLSRSFDDLKNLCFSLREHFPNILSSEYHCNIDLPIDTHTFKHAKAGDSHLYILKSNGCGTFDILINGRQAPLDYHITEVQAQEKMDRDPSVILRLDFYENEVVVKSVSSDEAMDIIRTAQPRTNYKPNRYNLFDMLVDKYSKSFSRDSLSIKDITNTYKPFAGDEFYIKVSDGDHRIYNHKNIDIQVVITRFNLAHSDKRDTDNAVFNLSASFKKNLAGLVNDEFGDDPKRCHYYKFTVDADGAPESGNGFAVRVTEKEFNAAKRISLNPKKVLYTESTQDTVSPSPN